MFLLKIRKVIIGFICLSFFQFPFIQANTEFGYHGELSPENWCAIDESYSVCCKGLAQSPVNIITDDAQKKELEALIFQYQTTALQVIHNGHTIQANVQDSENMLVIDGQPYGLLQFHFHTPSEHLVDGKEFPVEMHLVHKSVDGALAVVGILFQAGEANAELEKLWKSMPQPESEPVKMDAFEIKNLLPQNQKTYRYSGSLTTPPCSEAVRWNVLATPMTLSTEQIDTLMKMFSGDEFPDGNHRPVQPLNGRVIVTEAD